MLQRILKPPSTSLFRTSIRHASRIHDPPPPFPVLKSCPAPTCDCSPTPAMPEGLPINHEKDLNNTFAFSNEQIIICTGKSDWTSKIEDDDGGDNLATLLKGLIGPKGAFADPYHNVSVVNGSYASSTTSTSKTPSDSAYLFPSFKYIPAIPRDETNATALIRSYLQPTKLNAAHDALPALEREKLMRLDGEKGLMGMEVKDMLVMICGHGGRDMRCGVMGPVLQSEFERLLPKFGFSSETGAVDIDTQGVEGGAAGNSGIVARVGMVSHIGGHAYAGNVICCIPPIAKLQNGDAHPLAGCQIWYGRIEPRHVEGVIVQTLQQGIVLAEHFRGGIKQGGEVLRM